MSINLSRNTRLWVSTVNTGHDNSNTFEIPIQDGYTLSQSSSSSDVGVEEAGPTPTRGSKRFNESLDPAEWSFTTYITPYLQTENYLVDMILWHALASSKATAVDLDNTSTTSEVYGDATSFTVGFANNSAHVLTELYLYFKIDNQVYLVSKAQVNQAEISIDISDIGQVSWSGQGLTYNPIAAPAFIDSDGTNGLTFDPATPTADKYVAIAAGKKYIVNKLTVMDFSAEIAPGTNPANENYSIPITGATVTINNNVTYLTPNTLAEVDSPIGSFTGTFEVTGSIDAYLRKTSGTGAIGNEYGTAELLEHMLANVGSAVTTAGNIAIHIGGKASGDPVAIINIPTAHLSVPEVSVDDVISTTFEFKGIPSSTDLMSGDEISLEFKAAQ